MHINSNEFEGHLTYPEAQRAGQSIHLFIEISQHLIHGLVHNCVQAFQSVYLNPISSKATS